MCAAIEREREKEIELQLAQAQAQPATAAAILQTGVRRRARRYRRFDRNRYIIFILIGRSNISILFSIIVCLFSYALTELDVWRTLHCQRISDNVYTHRTRAIWTRLEGQNRFACVRASIRTWGMMMTFLKWNIRLFDFSRTLHCDISASRPRRAKIKTLFLMKLIIIL